MERLIKGAVRKGSKTIKGQKVRDQKTELYSVGYDSNPIYRKECRVIVTMYNQIGYYPPLPERNAGCISFSILYPHLNIL